MGKFMIVNDELKEMIDDVNDNENEKENDDNLSARDRAIEAFRKMYPNVSVEEAGRVVDGNFNRADYETQARTYNDTYSQMKHR